MIFLQDAYVETALVGLRDLYIFNRQGVARLSSTQCLPFNAWALFMKVTTENTQASGLL